MKRLQNKIAESRKALTITVIYALAVWYASGGVEQKLYTQLACIAVSAYLMVELNNANALIRIYSRMVSCTFLVLTTMATFLFASLRGTLTTLCFVSFYTILMHCYQDKQSPGLTFYAFLCLGIASLFFPQVVFFVPFLWLMMAFWLMAFSPRMFFASLLGLLAPYWFLAPWCAWSGHLPWLTEHVGALTDFSPLVPYPLPQVCQLADFAFVVLLSLIGMVHFLRNTSKDKIRTRMMYYIFISMMLLITLFIVLQPQHYEVLMGPLIVHASILFGHFIALTETRFTNISFLLLSLMALLITSLNLWMPSLTF